MGTEANGPEEPFRARAVPELSFLTIVIPVAVALTSALGWMSRDMDTHLREAEAERRLDASIERVQLERGWIPLVSGDASQRRLREWEGVELAAASRPWTVLLWHGPVTGEPPAPERMARAQEVVSHELRRYPPGALERIRLRRVLLCSALRQNDEPIPSIPNHERTLIIDVGLTDAAIVRIVHHEVFHFLDFADDGQLRADPAFRELNDRWFVYGTGGRFFREPGGAAFTTETPGFLSRYSTSAPEEDKAEIFSFLMSRPADVLRVVERDPIVARKVESVMAQAERHVPALDGHFWAEVAAGRR